MKQTISKYHPIPKTWAWLRCTLGVACALSIAVDSKAACDQLVLPVPPTDKTKTFIRKGPGEFGAPRKGGEATHQGSDITRNMSDNDPQATAVHAIANGTVATVGLNGSPTTGFGNIVVIDHGNGCYSMYAHLASKPFIPAQPGGNLAVKARDKVAGGQRIGYFVDIRSDTTSTGNAVSTDPAAREQMHFQLMEAPSGRVGVGSIAAILGKDGRIVDSTAFLKRLGYALH